MTIASRSNVAESTDAIRLGVKDLAQFVHRHGDIHYRYAPHSRIERMVL